MYIYRVREHGRGFWASRDQSRSGHLSRLQLRADARLSLRRAKPNSRWSSNRWGASLKVLLSDSHVYTSDVYESPSLEWLLVTRPNFSRRPHPQTFSPLRLHWRSAHYSPD